MPMVTFAANGRPCDGYLAPAAKPGPGVVVIQEWWGLVGHIQAVADRFAAAGFTALAPDLYHGEKTTSPDDAGKLLMALNIAEAGKDLAGALRYLRALDGVEPKRTGVVGFCMGGQLALFAAQEHPDLVDAAVDFYGIHPKVTLDAARLRTPLLGHFAAHDKGVPPAVGRDLRARVVAAGGHMEIHEYDAS
ncbi:MAG: dienelactone hydrolase family protein, partial [Gemmatimonadota bacterium]|nr:dienelactone hydrolase family protein [Gemmatimonadota bacterium]